jgi:hypothetical protein
VAERLAARIGDQSVQSVTAAEHRPQRAGGCRALTGGKAVVLSSIQRSLYRPLWMLPADAVMNKDIPLHQGHLTSARTPERLELSWWDDDGIARCYTAMNQGLRLWVFRNRGRTRNWYLHGIFKVTRLHRTP